MVIDVLDCLIGRGAICRHLVGSPLSGYEIGPFLIYFRFSWQEE